MKVFIVHAHPEPRSLNAALTALAVETLSGQGHTVEVSDLYRMSWKAAADGDDFTERHDPDRLYYIPESHRAFANGTQTADIAAEQAKLVAADVLIMQFPLWWFAMPAILKGWVDRVFASGLAYGVGDHSRERWGDRYGDGKLAEKRAMLSVTIGGRAPQYSPRGVNGFLDDLLFPMQHGMLFYTGMRVLPPHVVYRAGRLSGEQWSAIAQGWRERLLTLFTDEPIPYRRQNGGHYDGQQVLKPGLGRADTGTAIHLALPGEPVETR